MKSRWLNSAMSKNIFPNKIPGRQERKKIILPKEQTDRGNNLIRARGKKSIGAGKRKTDMRWEEGKHSRREDLLG